MEDYPDRSSCIFAVVLNLVVIWELIDGGNRKIDKPETFLLNTRVLTRSVFSIVEKGLDGDNSSPAWRESYGLENGSTGLARIPAKPFVNTKLAREVPRVRVVSSHYSSANFGAPLPPTLSQQEVVSSGRPIYDSNVVPMSFWQGFYNQYGVEILVFGPATNSFEVFWHSSLAPSAV
jgi:hypothetical protein